VYLCIIHIDTFELKIKTINKFDFFILLHYIDLFSFLEKRAKVNIHNKKKYTRIYSLVLYRKKSLNHINIITTKSRVCYNLHHPHNILRLRTIPILKDNDDGK